MPANTKRFVAKSDNFQIGIIEWGAVGRMLFDWGESLLLYGQAAKQVTLADGSIVNYLPPKCFLSLCSMYISVALPPLALQKLMLLSGLVYIISY